MTENPLTEALLDAEKQRGIASFWRFMYFVTVPLLVLLLVAFGARAYEREQTTINSINLKVPK